MNNSAQKLILIKHSLPAVNPNQDTKHWYLSEEGYQRAEKLVSHIKPLEPQLVITSTEPKAMQTGKILAQGIGKPFETAENLHEHDRTGVPFLTREDFEDLVRNLLTRPNELVFGNETGNAACERFTAAIHKLIASHKESFAVVAHGTVITLFTSTVNKVDDPFALWKSLDLPSYIVFSLPDLKLMNIVGRI